MQIKQTLFQVYLKLEFLPLQQTIPKLRNGMFCFGVLKETQPVSDLQQIHTPNIYLYIAQVQLGLKGVRHHAPHSFLGGSPSMPKL